MFPTPSRFFLTIPTVLLLLILAPALGWSQAVPDKATDTLERLRHPFEEADPEKLVQGISGIENLAEALLLLSLWDHNERADNKPVSAARATVTKRLEESIRKVFSGEDFAKKAALASFLGTMAERSQRLWAGSFDEPSSRSLVSLLPDLIKQSGSPDAGVRLVVAQTLGRFTFANDAAVSALPKLLADKDAAVRRAAAAALLHQAREGFSLGDPLPVDSPEYLRDKPQYSLPSPRVILTVALKGLESDDGEVRRGSLSSIAEVSRRAKGFVRWFPIPHDPVISPEVQASMKALEPVIPAVTALLKQESGDNVSACEVIEQLAILRLAVLRLQDKKDAIDPFRDPLKKALPGLAAVVSSRNVEARLAALYALEEFESEGRSTSAAVAKALSDTDPDVRWAAARVLGRMAPAGDKEAVHALAKVVSDDSVDVRITALAALERYGPAAAGEVKAIAKALSAKDAVTRLWATRALAVVGPKGREEAVEALSKALDDEEVRIRRVAAEGLVAFGPFDATTTKALRAALSDSDDEVRRHASRALLGEKK